MIGDCKGNNIFAFSKILLPNFSPLFLEAMNGVFQTLGGLYDIVVFPEIGVLEFLGLVVEIIGVPESLFAGNGDGLGSYICNHKFVDCGIAGLEQALSPVAGKADGRAEVFQPDFVSYRPIIQHNTGFLGEEAEAQGLGNQDSMDGLSAVTHVQGSLYASKGKVIPVQVYERVIKRIRNFLCRSHSDNQLQTVSYVHGHLHLKVVMSPFFSRKQEPGILKEIAV
jgi:hypothetical protein